MKTRVFSITIIVAIMLFISLIILLGSTLNDDLLAADFSRKNSPPSLEHFFGTDNYGRDIFYRTLSGLSKSLIIGILSSIVSSVIALFVGTIAGVAPRWLDNAINFLIDMIMSIPHLVLLILISFCVGRGLFGVVFGIIATHWTHLARVIRGEVLQIKEQQYILTASKLGSSKIFIATKHILPHILPQFIIGIVLLFPHAILHESAITFLGFGLPPELPTIGIMLSESMSFVMSGMWWLFLPGVSLVVVVLLFDVLGKRLKELLQYKKLRGGNYSVTNK